MKCKFLSLLSHFNLGVDECLKFPEMCHKYANCTYYNGSYSCLCNKGYIGNGKFNCTGNTFSCSFVTLNN